MIFANTMCARTQVVKYVLTPTDKLKGVLENHDHD